MPIAPRVRETQSRATSMQRSAKLRLTMAKAWRERRRDEYPMTSPTAAASVPPARAPAGTDQSRSSTSSTAV
jgi:hypothetical protein